jgi:hypothetical protein
MGIRSQNNPLAAYLDVFSNTGTDAMSGAGGGGSAAPTGLTATGGVISDYVDGTEVYRAHVFTSSGTFDVTAIGASPDAVDYLVVAGGGGGSDRGNGAGGGGAGGLLSTHPDIPAPRRQTVFNAAVRTYTMTVGAGGGGGGEDKGPNTGSSGGDSSITYPGPNTIVTTTGGGRGGRTGNGADGGSGGGGDDNSIGGSGTGSGSSQQGFPGGASPSYAGGGGGGGASAAGEAGGTPTSGGGDGFRVRIAGPLNNGVGASGPGSEFAWFAGGGGGGRTAGPQSPGGYGGGGQGAHQSSPDPDQPVNYPLRQGVSGTGGGGGSGADPSPKNDAGSGGSGVIIVRYQIGVISKTAKATGGSISFYNSGSGLKTIHAFTGSGTFATEPNWSAADVEYVVIGGGGGGGVNEHGGGGGAGAYRTGTTPIGAHPVSTTIQVGGGGIQNKGLANPLPDIFQGSSSYFGTPITSPGGGGGGVDDNQSPFPTTAPAEQGMPGGSGGGNALDKTDAVGPATGQPFPGTIGATPPAGWGHPGGVGSRSPIGGGGGGGAGGAGAAPPTKLGGIGIQLPATFRDPISTVGAPGPTSPSVTGADTSGKYYVAGGGAAHPAASGSAGGGGYFTPSPEQVYRAVQNTGSGGGASPIPYVTSNGRSGGASGLVLIAYPS